MVGFTKAGAAGIAASAYIARYVGSDLPKVNNRSKFY